MENREVAYNFFTFVLESKTSNNVVLVINLMKFPPVKMSPCCFLDTTECSLLLVLTRQGMDSAGLQHDKGAVYSYHSLASPAGKSS